jgi:pyochelin biosynthetic protein PchC
VAAERAGGPGQWLHRFVPAHEPAVRLICFPHAGGAATAYRLWPRALAGDVDLLAVQLPGRGARRREPSTSDLAAIVEGVAGELLALAGPPLVLFGHSLGATIAHETAHRLTAEGAPVAGLAVSARPGPSRARRRDEPRSDEEIWRAVRRLGGTPQEILEHPAFRALALDALRADYAISDRHEPAARPPLDLDVLALGGADDPLATAEDLAAWAEVTRGRFVQHTRPGGHFYLDDELPAVAALLGAELLGPASRAGARTVTPR